MIFKLINLSNKNKILFMQTSGEESPQLVLGVSRNKSSSVLAQKITNFAKDNKKNIARNVAAGTLVVGGGVALGFGIAEMFSEISKAQKQTFSPETSAFHAFFNNHQDTLMIDGSLAHIQDPNFIKLVSDESLKPLFDALATNSPKGIDLILKDPNFFALLQNDGFKTLLSNQESLNLLLKNASVFSEANIPLINTLMGNKELQTLFENKDFVALLSDEKFVSMLNPHSLGQFYRGQQVIDPNLASNITINQKYIDVLNNESLKPILQNSEIQEILSNPEMIAFMQDPKFTAIYNDPALKSLLTNPDLQNILMNKEFVEILSNPEFIKIINNPEVMNMISSKGFINMINTPGFNELLKDQEAILALVNDPGLQNYLNAVNEVGITSSQITGAIALLIGGVAAMTLGMKFAGVSDEKGKNNNKQNSNTSPNSQGESKSESILEKLFSAIKSISSKAGRTIGSLIGAARDLISGKKKIEEEFFRANTFRYRTAHHFGKKDGSFNYKEFGEKIFDQIVNNVKNKINNITPSSEKKGQSLVDQKLDQNSDAFKEVRENFASNFDSYALNIQSGVIENLTKDEREGKMFSIISFETTLQNIFNNIIISNIKSEDMSDQVKNSTMIELSDIGLALDQVMKTDSGSGKKI